MKKRLGVFLGVIFIAFTAQAVSIKNAVPQIISGDSSKHLAAVTVSGVRYKDFFTGAKFAFIDSNQLSLFQQQSVGNVLASQTPIFIKSYGPGALSTPSFRGGNANHTAIIWNGFNLQNPMSGQVDLNHIPSFIIDNIAIQFGSQAVLFGSGNIGGAVHLNSNIANESKQGLTVLLGAGSFGSATMGIKYNFGRTKWQMQQKIFVENAENNFSYKAMDALYPQVRGKQNSADLVTHRAVNAERQNAVWLQEFQYKFSGKHKLQVRTWLQNHDRNIPPALHAPLLKARQKDQSAKAMLEYQFNHNKYELQARYAYFLDALTFKNTQITESYSLASSATAFVDQFYRTQHYQWQGSLMVQKLNAQLRGVSAQWQQEQVALFSTFKFHLLDGNLKQQISLRQEWVNGAAIPLMPAYGISYKFSPVISLDGNVSRNYRLPTFNDLYWPSMGNPNLKPEFGWNQELSLNVRKSFASASLTYFNKNVNNWIIWVPAGGNLSKPMNVYKVWSRGLEFAWKVQFKMRKSQLICSGMHDYTLTTNSASTLLNDASINKQLIYTPRIKHQMQWQYARGKYALQYIYNYIGTRFVSSDHSNWLMPYSLHSLNLSKTWNWFRKNWQTQILVNNLLNTSYQVMVNQPMPLVNYQLSLNLKL